MGHALAVGNDNADAMIAVVAADDPGMAPLQNLRHHAFLATAIIEAAESRQHPVAVEQLRHFPRVEEQVVGLVVGNKETETVLVALHPPRVQIHVGRKAVDATTVADNLPVPAHGGQPPQQSLHLLRIGELEPFPQHFKGHRLPDLFKLIQNKLPTGYGIGIKLRFALSKGIGGFSGFGPTGGHWRWDSIHLLFRYVCG